ncbi:RraA family protein [Georgenia sp. Z1491]|uniref:RraA family protein n=1 Tax=Georgenia sp. Z1491 TaxID=3416707 RepID=UPI003CE951F9
MTSTYSPQTIEAFRAITTASVSDALQGLGVHGHVSSEIRLQVGDKLVGPASTVKEGPTDEAVPPQHALDALDVAEAGSVMVIDLGGELDVAAWGGLMTAGAVARDVGGVVLDTCVRDLTEIERDFPGFTVFARGTSPATTVGRFRTLSAGEPVEIAGVTVRQGDLIVADRDGVVVVPAELVDDTLAAAQEIEEREKEQTKLILESGSLLTGLAKYQRI